MKNRKAKMLLLRAHKNGFPSQWLKVSNRRVALFSYDGARAKDGR